MPHCLIAYDSGWILNTRTMHRNEHPDHVLLETKKKSCWLRSLTSKSWILWANEIKRNSKTNKNVLWRWWDFDNTIIFISQVPVGLPDGFYSSMSLLFFHFFLSSFLTFLFVWLFVSFWCFLFSVSLFRSPVKNILIDLYSVEAFYCLFLAAFYIENMMSIGRPRTKHRIWFSFHSLGNKDFEHGHGHGHFSMAIVYVQFIFSYPLKVINYNFPFISLL